MNALIIEDERLAARNLLAILKEIGDIQIAAVLETIQESVVWFNNHPQPDVLFLDIHLADGSAFEIFERANISCLIIFTTAYDEYALKAFKVNSIDYLLKPIEADSVRAALQKLRKLMAMNRTQTEWQTIAALFKAQAHYKTHFLVPVKGDKLIPVHSEQFAFICIENGVVKAWTHDQKIYVLEHSIDELTGILDPCLFFRANRQFIVARHAIRDIDLWHNNRLSLNLRPPVPYTILISKARVVDFKSWFTGR